MLCGFGIPFFNNALKSCWFVNKEMRNRALIVVQEQSLHQEIVDSLQTTALEIDCAETYAQAISLYARFHYVLVVLALGIPDDEGVTIPH